MKLNTFSSRRNMRLAISATYAVLTLPLAACGSFYKEPAAGVPVARIRFATQTDLGLPYIFILQYDSDACETHRVVGALSGVFDNHRRQDRGLPLGEQFLPKYKTEISIPANRPMVYSMGFFSNSIYTSGYKCWVSAKFDPKENVVYEATYNADGKSCRTAVTKIVQNNGSYVRVPEESAKGLPKACEFTH